MPTLSSMENSQPYPVSSGIAVYVLLVTAGVVKTRCSQLLLWEPTNGRRRGAPAKTYVKLLEEDTDTGKEDLLKLMVDRQLWRATLMASEACGLD